jgi:hypothetical protein
MIFSLKAASSTPTFITIDVEGYELAALAGLDLERWNSSGTSEEIPLHMDRRGYVRFMSTDCNDWYCAKSGWRRAEQSSLLRQLRL